MAEWDAEDFQPDSGFTAPKAPDKWAGEDEDDVKDSWEEDEKEASEGSASGDDGVKKAYQKKKKKPLAERIAEKELAEKKQKEEEEAAKKAQRPLTAVEKLAEKQRLQKIQQEADLKVAQETFGLTQSSSGTGIDGMQPESEEEFTQFEGLLKEKLFSLQASSCFTGFLEKLFTDLALSSEPEDVKKFGSIFNSIYHEKLRLAKEQENKKKKKKGKATIKIGKSDDLDDMVAAASTGNFDYDDDYI